jgi:prepilin-type N-terminal cleavage/methylation domain-containing protein
MSTIRFRFVSSEGFSLIEVLVALALSLMIAMTVSTVWISTQRSQVEAADRVSARLMTRVVAARFEKDLRHATIEGCGTAITGSLLRAESQEVVMLSIAGGHDPELVEWEVVGGSLMRRHGPWTGLVPPRSQHHAYTSNKTMLEGVGPSTGFAYGVTGLEVPQVADGDLRLVTRVYLSGLMPDLKVHFDASAEVGS